MSKARERKYLDARNQPVSVHFRSQSVLEPFCDETGAQIRDASIDLVNCIGAVGSHFDPQATELLMREIARVVRPRGLVLLDCGAKGTDFHTLQGIAKAQGLSVQTLSRSSFLDIYPQVCFLKD